MLSYDRDIVRIATEKLPPYHFDLVGYMRAFEIMERHFCLSESDSEDPPLTLKFSRSTLNKDFRSTNKLIVDNINENGLPNYGYVLTTLLNQKGPGTSALSTESSGEALITI